MDRFPSIPAWHLARRANRSRWANLLPSRRATRLALARLHMDAAARVLRNVGGESAGHTTTALIGAMDRCFAGGSTGSSTVNSHWSTTAPGLETHAQCIAAQLLARAGASSEGPDLQRVDVDSLELVRPRSVGVPPAEGAAPGAPGDHPSQDQPKRTRTSLTSGSASRACSKRTWISIASSPPSATSRGSSNSTWIRPSR